AKPRALRQRGGDELVARTAAQREDPREEIAERARRGPPVESSSGVLERGHAESSEEPSRPLERTKTAQRIEGTERADQLGLVILILVVPLCRDEGNSGAL